ncbi:MULTISPECIES: hypothetical protein [Chitinophagaceae]
MKKKSIILLIGICSWMVVSAQKNVEAKQVTYNNWDSTVFFIPGNPVNRVFIGTFTYIVSADYVIQIFDSSSPTYKVGFDKLIFDFKKKQSILLNRKTRTAYVDSIVVSTDKKYDCCTVLLQDSSIDTHTLQLMGKKLNRADRNKLVFFPQWSIPSITTNRYFTPLGLLHFGYMVQQWDQIRYINNELSDISHLTAIQVKDTVINASYEALLDGMTLKPYDHTEVVNMVFADPSPPDFLKMAQDVLKK